MSTTTLSGTVGEQVPSAPAPSRRRLAVGAMVAVAVVVSLQTVGVALMLALLVTPASTAYLLTRRLWTMMLLGAGFGVLAGVVGLYLSYYAGIASGAAIVLVASGLFVVVLLFGPRRGLLWRR